MNEQTSSNKQWSKNIQTHFCMLDPEIILSTPQRNFSKLPYYWENIFENLRANLTSIVHTVNTPFSAVKASVIMVELNKLLQEKNHGQAPSIYEAQNKLLQSLEETERSEKIFKEIYIQLEQHMKIESLYKSYEEIHSQAIVMIAGALEIFFTDTFIQIFNHNPKKAVHFLCDPTIKKSVHKSRINIEDIAQMDFNLQNKMGDYIFSGRRIDSPSFFKKVCNIVFNQSPQDPNQVIEQLFQKRHIIVHRRGRLDQKFSQKIKEPNLPGKMIISPPEIENSLKGAWSMALETLSLLESMNH